MKRSYWKVTWLDEAGFLVFFALVLFVAGLFIGQLVEIPHFLFGPNRPMTHHIWDLIAAGSFLFIIYHGWIFGWTTYVDMVDLSGKFIGLSMIVGAAIPLGFMLTYQFRTPGESQEMVYNLFFYGPLLIMGLGIVLTILTPLTFSPCWKRICHARQ